MKAKRKEKNTKRRNIWAIGCVLDKYGQGGRERYGLGAGMAYV